MNLVASVIVKNELGRYLQACIGSLREFCDIVAVLDDGSTDRTAEWLDDNADDRMAVMHLVPEDGFFAGHEGRKRQALLDFTLSLQPTYILAIDADEFVGNGDIVRAFCETDLNLGSLVMEEVWEYSFDGLQVRQDGGWREHPVPILFRATNSALNWRILDRALACGREPMWVRGVRAQPTGTSVFHFGWANPATRQERYDRYAQADGGKFHASRHLDSILWNDRRVRLTWKKWPVGLRERLK